VVAKRKKTDIMNNTLTKKAVLFVGVVLKDRNTIIIAAINESKGPA
jgi:hypothetical protein